MEIGIILNGILTWIWVQSMRIVGEVTREIRIMTGIYPSKPTTFKCPVDKVQYIDAATLDKETFIKEYVQKGIPVVVKGAIADWPAMQKWDCQFFAKHFGDCPIRIQDNYFRTIKNATIADFIAEVEQCEQEVTDPLNPGRTVPYVRYHLAKGELNELYRFCGLFSWIKGKYFTHECFLRLKGDWHMPKFFPTTGTTFPFSVFGYQGPCERFFYDFGIYIAPKGAITRLHIDGSRTHAVLFQVKGKKSGVLFPPQALPWFTGAHLPADEPDFIRFPDEWKRALPMQPLHFEYEAGDLAFVPRCWLHEVYTEETSVTLTFNFNYGVREVLQSAWDFLYDGWYGACVYKR